MVLGKLLLSFAIEMNSFHVFPVPQTIVSTYIMRGCCDGGGEPEDEKLTG